MPFNLNLNNIMAFEFPTDLIHQVQISLRKDAGLSSYNPLDPILQPLPSLAASVAGFYPSPPHLRCKHCKRRLLNGLHSLICGYCGKYHKGDVPPEPISFKSTSGCHFLLKSLGLKESEMIGVPNKGTESKGGPSMPKKRIPLTKLLDLQIKWPDRSLIPETNTTNNTIEHTTAFLNDFFPGSKNDTIQNSKENQQEISNRIESTESKSVPCQDNLTLFDTLLPSETAVRSSNNTSGNALTGWDVKFQSADSRNQHEGFESFDSFIDSTSAVDLSADMDSVFGGEKMRLDSNVEGNVDWFQDNQRETNMPTNEGDDPFDEWNAFTSSIVAQDPSSNEMATTVSERKSEINLFDSTNNSKEEMDFGSFSQADLRSAEASLPTEELYYKQFGSIRYKHTNIQLTEMFRTGGAKSRVPDDTKLVAQKGNMVNVPPQPNNGAENMHCKCMIFCFMLNSNLSVPSKSDGISPQD